MTKRIKFINLYESPERSRYAAVMGEYSFVCDGPGDAAQRARKLSEGSPDSKPARVVLEHYFDGQWLPVAHFIPTEEEDPDPPMCGWFC